MARPQVQHRFGVVSLFIVQGISPEFEPEGHIAFFGFVFRVFGLFGVPLYDEVVFFGKNRIAHRGLVRFEAQAVFLLFGKFRVEFGFWQRRNVGKNIMGQVMFVEGLEATILLNSRSYITLGNNTNSSPV